ncbi:MAG: hypothetical protein KME20_06945 [Kaiparowitsia implicata GSE-PSE-MK54-09C]|jgi:hypothetical protein|nr:hypothetical protein [Kaiparowitsia implicata GSE-PSE-MK54-09C]
MRLRQRTAEWEYEPVGTGLIEADVFGQEREQAFGFSYPRQVPVPQSIWASVGDRSSAPITEVGCRPTPSNTCPPFTQRLNARIHAHQQQLQQAEQVHRSNLEQRLQHRLEVAIARGDQRLVHQLHLELQDLTAKL